MDWETACELVCVLHKEYTINTQKEESNIQKWLSAVRVWKPRCLIVSSLLDHRGTLVAEGKQLPSFISSALPCVFMCYVSTQRRPISFPPCKNDLWPALACLRDAPILQKKIWFFVVTQQERVLQCSTEVQMEQGWCYTVHSLRQLADILQSFTWRQHLLHCVSNLSTAKSARKLYAESLLLPMSTGSKCIKRSLSPRWLLDHLLQDIHWTGAMNIWITDSHLRPDKVIAKAKSSWDPDHSLE